MNLQKRKHASLAALRELALKEIPVFPSAKRVKFTEMVPVKASATLRTAMCIPTELASTLAQRLQLPGTKMLKNVSHARLRTALHVSVALIHVIRA